MNGLPPGPRLPALAQGLWFAMRPVDYFEICRKRYGDPFTVLLPSTPPVIMFSEPQAIRDIFTGDENVLRAGEATVILRPIVGVNSLLLLDGERHHRERRMMSPPFHGERMRAYAEVMREATERAIARWPLGEPFPLMRETQAITLEIILRAVFGMTDGAAMAALSDKLRRFITAAVNPIYLWQRLQVDLGPLTPWGRFLRLRREIDALLDAEIATRRNGGPERDDVLSLLLAARDETGAPMGDAELRDELMTLLLAGHETTASSLAWTVHRILTEPGVHERAASDGDYLDAVIKETMRMNPVIPDVMRIVKAPIRIGSHDIPVGVGVAPNIYAAHHRADTWGDPYVFRPDRFLGTKPGPYEFFPFGGGMRRCLGAAFALYEMKVVLSTLLARTELAIAPGYRLRVVRRNITWAPSDGMPVVVTRRAA